jgi:hypothetical protein
VTTRVQSGLSAALSTTTQCQSGPVNGRPVAVPASQEYPRLFECFAGLIHAGRIDVDLAPLKLVADAFLVGHRIEVEPFAE